MAFVAGRRLFESENSHQASRPKKRRRRKLPQDERLSYKMILGLRMAWSHSIRLTCFAAIFQPASLRTTR